MRILNHNSSLTHRQNQVVSGIASSLTTRQIAPLMGISDKCVQYHVQQIKKALKIPPGKTGSYNPYIALFTRYAYENALIKLNEKGEVLDSYLARNPGPTEPRGGSTGNKKRGPDLGSASISTRCLVRVLHHKRNAAHKPVAALGRYHKPRSHQRRSATGLHKLSRSRGVLFHNDGE